MERFDHVPPSTAVSEDSSTLATTPPAPPTTAYLLRPPADALPSPPPLPDVSSRSLPTAEPLPSGWDPASTIRNFLLVACKVTLVVVLAWGLLFNFSEVRGSSMEPGIHDRDRILVDHVSYMFAEVARGDVVVLRYPLDPTLDYIKRVIGLPGDRVVIGRGKVWINGVLLDEPYVDASSIEPWTTLDTEVREGHYFVLGDNRRRSSDSREFGQVPFEYLRGKVRFRLWPLARLGWID